MIVVTHASKLYIPAQHFRQHCSSRVDYGGHRCVDQNGNKWTKARLTVECDLPKDHEGPHRNFYGALWPWWKRLWVLGVLKLEWK